MGTVTVHRASISNLNFSKSAIRSYQLGEKIVPPTYRSAIETFSSSFVGKVKLKSAVVGFVERVYIKYSAFLLLDLKDS